MSVFLLSTKNKHTNLINFFNFKTCQVEGSKYHNSQHAPLRQSIPLFPPKLRITPTS